MPELHIYPLEPLTQETDPQEWSKRTPATATEREYWTTTRDVCVHLPGVDMLSVWSFKWETYFDVIHVTAGYQWDGASGPAIDDPAAVMASLVHDIICTRVGFPWARTCPLPSYWARHWLYARIIRAQGEPAWRYVADWIGLVAANWIVDVAKRREGAP